jgi:hypothetical protein
VIGAFLLVIVCSIKNRVVRRFRRLREPRYLAGLIVGLVYLYFFVFRNQMRSARHQGRGFEALASFAPDLVAAGALVLWGLAALLWLWPSASKAWTFTGAEVQFFFTAPVTRRSLLNYKLLRPQLGLLFGVAIASLFSGAANASAAGRWSFVLGGWLLFAVIMLHVLGANLTKAGFRARASKVPPLAWASAAVMLAASGAVIGSIAARAPQLLSLPVSEAFRAVIEASRSGIAAWALWPYAAMVAPVLAAGPAAFARALGPALAVAAVNYWWVLASDARLEEATVVAERDVIRGRRRPPKIVVRAAPFTLAPTGRLETAVLWKNTIQLSRYASVATLIRVLLPIALLAFVFGLNARAGSLVPVVLMLMFFATLMGPYMFRNDLRMDLPRLAVLKTWPISGRELLVGEITAPWLMLSVVVWFLVAVAWGLSPTWSAGPRDAIARASLAAAAAVLAPMLIAGQLLVQNAAVVLFPAWIATGGSRARGVEAMGQNILMFAGTLLSLALGVLPALVVGGAVGWGSYLLFGWPGLLPGAVVFSGVLLGEAAVVVAWLGRVLERTDPSQIEVPE